MSTARRVCKEGRFFHPLWRSGDWELERLHFPLEEVTSLSKVDARPSETSCESPDDDVEADESSSDEGIHLTTFEGNKTLREIKRWGK
jgi:hypothetical protein